MTSNVDGSKGLADQEITLNGLELANFAKVTKYVKKAAAGASGGTVNEATLEDALPGHHQLSLASVDLGADTSPVIQQQRAAGRAEVFSGTAYVSGNEKTVMGFRQAG
jgi:hypothetical protein